MKDNKYSKMQKEFYNNLARRAFDQKITDEEKERKVWNIEDEGGRS